MKDTFNRKDISTFVLVVIASFLCAVNINTFINAGGLFPGGFTGLTVLFSDTLINILISLFHIHQCIIY